MSSGKRASSPLRFVLYGYVNSAAFISAAIVLRVLPAYCLNFQNLYARMPEHYAFDKTDVCLFTFGNMETSGAEHFLRSSVVGPLYGLGRRRAQGLSLVPWIGVRYTASWGGTG
ncbi:MAG: hypothetical protein ACOX17_09645 [Christensenellales bacterium]|jgi:hypothetical protein